MPCASMAETTKKSLSTPKLQKSKLPSSPTSLTPQTPAPLRRSGRRASLGLDFSQPACSAQKPINDSSDYRCSVRGSDESDPQAHQVSRVSLHEKNSRNARKRARKDEIRECLDSPSPLKIERNESNRKAQPSGRKKDGMVEVKVDFCPVSPDLVETKKRKLGREGNVTTRSVVTRSAKLEETKSKNKKLKKRVYYKKVAFDGGEFAVGDDVYVKRREDASSDDEIAEEEECRICFKAGNSVMVECDDCLGGFHLKCLKPPLKEIPEGDWICRFCEAWKSDKELEFPKPPEGNKRLRTLREKLLSSDLWAAHIESLWKDIDGSYWFRGQWYIIPEETAVGRQAHTLRRELYRTNDFADIEMESVIQLCSVLSPKDYAKANNEGDDVFLCEYEYDIHWHSFKRIAEIDNNDEVGEDDESDEDWKHCEDDNSDTDGDMEYEEENVQNASRSSQSHTQAANSRKGGFFGLQKIGTKRIPEHVRCHKQTDLERAKATLLLATLPKSLPCRNKEMEEITAFIKGAISGDQCLGRCLYVHGVPGTGKTMSVLAVMRGLRSEVDAGKIRSYCFVEVNGLKLATPENIYKVIYEALSGHRVSWKKALHSLNERFSEGKKIHKEDDRPCILLIDELDLLVTRNQSVLYNILDWPTKPHSKLIVIGIANTMDLPEKLLPRISSRMGIQRLCFGPYNYQQLQEIISSRLRGTDVFEKQAIEFASRKVAAISGDARRALEICRRAAEVADYRSKKQIDSGDSPCNDKVVVGMAEVEAAIQEMFQAPHIQVMKTCSKLGKIFLTAMVYELYTTGMSETTFEKVANTVSRLCGSQGEAFPGWDALLKVGCRLGECRIILCESAARQRLQKLQLNFPSEDVTFALKDSKDLPWLAKYL